MGYDVSYLKRMQDAELEQLALDAMLTRANIACLLYTSDAADD